jgi:polysaccharide pyruvyl transferase WcaK-like protein
VSPLLLDPAERSALEGAGAVVLLVGGYDGSANYGDIAMLDAAVELVERLGPRVAALPVVEAVHRETHARLYPAGPGQRRPAATIYHAVPGDSPPGDLAPAALPTGMRAGAVYLYGGGYLNPWWGERKLAMARAGEALLREVGLPRADVVSSGLQVDAGWLAGIDPRIAEPLGRAGVIGVRDEASAAAVTAAGHPAENTGDDAVGPLLPWVGTASRAPAPAQVNLQVNPASWITGASDALLAHLADLLAALWPLAERIQPFIAYDDPNTSERPALERLRELCGDCGIPRGALAEPVMALPDRFDEWIPVLARGVLTLSSSYHVSLTSLLTGVPAALITDNDYYVQKSAGLRADFGLPEAFAVLVGGDTAATAAALTAALAPVRERLAVAAGPVVGRRLRAERDVLGRLAAGLLAAAAESPGDEDGHALALALLRADHQTVVHRAESEAARAAALTARLAEREARHHELVAEVHQLNGIGASERERRIWLEQALAAAQESQRAESERRATAEQALTSIAASVSWRFTAPLRALARRLRSAGRRAP